MGRDGPLIVDDDEHAGRLVDAGEIETVVEVPLRRGTFTDPGTGDAVVAACSEGHRRADGLRELGAHWA